MKKNTWFKIEEDLFDVFKITTGLKNENPNDVVESLIKDYVIKSKVDVNEALKIFWEGGYNENKNK